MYELIHEFMEDFKNKLIVKIAKHTHLYATTIYTVLSKVDDPISYAEEIANNKDKVNEFLKAM